MSPVTTESSQSAPGPAQPEPAQPAAQQSAGNNNNTLRIGILVVIAAVVGVGVWLALSHNSKKNNSGNGGNVTSAIGPNAVSQSGLRDQAARLAGPLYWAGPKRGYHYEFQRTTNGHLYVRYLPKGVGIKQKPGRFLIVATYPWSHPYSALKKIAHGRGVDGPGGSFIIPARPGDSTSVLIAWPRGSDEVEVYHPTPGKAAAIAASGLITTVG
jgi:hypothetical protein